MSRPPGPEQPAGAAETEIAFRDRLLHALAQWQQRLAGGVSSSEARAIAREAAEFRTVAQSRHWATAQHLLYLENIALNAAQSLPQALGAVSSALRLAQVAVSPYTVRLDPLPARRAPAVASSVPPPVAPQPPPLVPLAPPHGGPVAPPPLIGSSTEARAAPAPPRHPSGHPIDQKAPAHRSDPPAAHRSDQRPDQRSDPRAERPGVVVPVIAPLARSVELPDSLAQPRAPPSLLARSMLGLRAFRKKADGPDLASGAGSESPRDGASAAAPRAGQDPAGALFGFRRLTSDPDPLVGGRKSSRPPLVEGTPRWSSRPVRGTDPPRRPSEEPGSRASSRPSRAAPRPEPAVPRWFYVLAALVALLGVATIATIVALGRHPKEKETRPTVAVVKPAAPEVATEPSADMTSSVEQVSLAVHEHGSETPQLRALLDLQGKLAAGCRDDPARCGRGWTPFAKEALTPLEIKDFTPSSSDVPLAAWLKRLKIPRDLPVRDEPALRGSFDFNTKNIAGHQSFQARLFECSAYSDIFESTFIKYGTPTWLTAIVYQESGCNPRATSPVGAKGLWQFMPESARAYGLRVVEGDVDERLNPVKSTDAAVHFLTDLQRKLGAWDLALAAYNMGPFAIIARLAQIGGSASFWDLVHAHFLPEETAGYVPAIEAYALILDNVSRLQFSRDGKRLESTAEVVVKPGTRLSLVARASSTTTVHIRDLNPEFLRDVVPEGETTARVPDAEAHRAQAFLETWAPDDSRDTCVPDDFDWGAKQFERSSYAKACAAGAPR